MKDTNKQPAGSPKDARSTNATMPESFTITLEMQFSVADPFQIAPTIRLTTSFPENVMSSREVTVGYAREYFAGVYECPGIRRSYASEGRSARAIAVAQVQAVMDLAFAKGCYEEGVTPT